MVNNAPYIIAAVQATYFVLTNFSISGTVATLSIKNNVGFDGYRSCDVLITTIC